MNRQKKVGTDILDVYGNGEKAWPTDHKDTMSGSF